MIGSAPAAETSGGMGVGPGDMRRYLFIIDATSLTANNRTFILDIIVADGYMMGHLFYKVLLSVSPKRPLWPEIVVPTLADSRVFARPFLEDVLAFLQASGTISGGSQAAMLSEDGAHLWG
jgi:hypothetical protein